MNEYTPDVWVVLEFNSPTLSQPLRKVFAGWYGGFAGSNSWQLNSGIASTQRSGDWLEFTGYSGSVYHCHTNNYHMSGLMHSVLHNWLAKAEDLDNTTIRILSLDEVTET